MTVELISENVCQCDAQELGCKTLSNPAVQDTEYTAYNLQCVVTSGGILHLIAVPYEWVMLRMNGSCHI